MITEREYEALQERFRAKLKHPPYEYRSGKRAEGYKAGVKACMSILSEVFHNESSEKTIATISFIKNKTEKETLNQLNLILPLHAEGDE